MINRFRKLKTIDKVALVYSLIPILYLAVCIICFKISGGDYYWSPHLSSKALELLALILVLVQCGLLLFVKLRIGLIVGVSVFINSLFYVQMFCPIIFVVLLLTSVIALVLIIIRKRKFNFILNVILPILLMFPFVFADMVIVNYGKFVTHYTQETYVSAEEDYVIEEITNWHFDEPRTKEVLIRDNQNYDLIFINLYGKTKTVERITHFHKERIGEMGEGKKDIKLEWLEDKDYTIEWVNNEEFKIGDVVYKVSDYLDE